MRGIGVNVVNGRRVGRTIGKSFVMLPALLIGGALIAMVIHAILIVAIIVFLSMCVGVFIRGCIDGYNGNCTGNDAKLPKGITRVQ